MDIKLNDFYVLKEVQEGLENWVYALTKEEDYYLHRNILITRRDVLNNTIIFSVNHKNKKLVFKASNLRNKKGFLLVDYFLKYKKWVRLTPKLYI